MSPAMAVHGGAWAIPQDQLSAHREGCRRALEEGLRILDSGGSSLDAVAAAVIVLENDEAFDAGRGSFLNEAGTVVLDAGIMDGRSLACGSVAHVVGVRNPVMLARKVLESPHAVLVGEGAHEFAVRNGIETCDPEELVASSERARWNTLRGVDMSAWAVEMFGDTVGAAALDAAGNLAAATSTGGSPMKPLGRVGDSPFIGAGLYASNQSAAVSATGHGELIIPLVWSKAAADLVAAGLPATAAASCALDLLSPVGARAGLIIVDRDGLVGAAWNTPAMAYAFRDGQSDNIVAGPDGQASA
jgi:beta-aspartyl-peptidase (threonine type)